MNLLAGPKLAMAYLKEFCAGRTKPFEESPVEAVGPSVIVNSFPKSGTHLLGKLTQLLGFSEMPVMLLNNQYLDFRIKGDWDSWLPIKQSNLTNIQNPKRVEQLTLISLTRLRNGQAVTSHISCRPDHRAIIQKRKIKHLFIVRDLRDVVISQMRYRMSLNAHSHLPKWYYYLNALQTDQDRIETVLNGRDRFLEPYTRHLDYGWKWVEDPNVHVVRYEDLIGPNGGSTVEAQLEAVRKVCIYLEIDRSPNDINSISGQLWGGNTRTMNVGRSNYWQEYFNDQIRQIFSEKYRSYQEALGYDCDW